jgi:hypothetical protein
MSAERRLPDSRLSPIMFDENVPIRRGAIIPNRRFRALILATV